MVLGDIRAMLNVPNKVLRAVPPAIYSILVRPGNSYCRDTGELRTDQQSVTRSMPMGNVGALSVTQVIDHMVMLATVLDLHNRGLCLQRQLAIPYLGELGTSLYGNAPEMSALPRNGIVSLT